MLTHKNAYRSQTIPHNHIRVYLHIIISSVHCVCLARTLGLHIKGIEEDGLAKKQKLFQEDECIVQINDIPLQDKTFTQWVCLVPRHDEHKTNSRSHHAQNEKKWKHFHDTVVVYSSSIPQNNISNGDWEHVFTLWHIKFKSRFLDVCCSSMEVALTTIFNPNRTLDCTVI